MASEMWRTGSIRILVCAAATLLCLPPCSAAVAADERLVLSIEPAAIQQGDTVLLTITGENMPTGTVIVEFFPQQIALLDILASSAEEILAQVKVPSLAPPGAYNVLIYNQLGEDVFGEGLLLITSDVITPVFKDYEPKSIGEVTDGFALLLLGDAITPEVVAHLTMRWRQADRPLDHLTTSFSKGAHGQILCAVTGEIPSGVLQGRIYLNDTPIYMAEVTNTTAGGIIVGQQQIKLNSAEAPYTITLLGTGFSAGFLSDLNIELSSPEITSRAREISLVDDSQFAAAFNGPLPAGSYALNVLRGDQTIYSGELELDAPAVSDADTAINGADNAADTRSDNDSMTIDSSQTVAAAEAGAVPSVEYSIHVTDVAPRQISPGTEAASFAISAAGLSPEVIEGLTINLSIGETSANLLFVGSGRDHLTCLFAPPAGGWLPGSIGALTIEDPQGQVEPFSAQLVVAPEETSAVLPEPLADPIAPTVASTDSHHDEADQLTVPDGWGISRATVTQTAETSILTIEFSSPETEPDIDRLGGSFTLLPADSHLLQAGEGLTLNGPLSFSLNAAGQVTGSALGTFTSGDLLISMGSGTAPLELMSYELVVVDSPVGAPAAGFTISVVDNECVIDGAGLEFSLLVSGELPDLEAIADVSLESDNLLFNMNLPNFRQSSSLIATGNPGIVILRLDRLTAQLSEIAFQVLADELIEADNVTIVFTWATLGYSISEDLAFSGKKPGAANDIFI